MFKATNIIISSNMQYRRDGLPYAKQKKLDDMGVAVYFTYDGQQRVLASDSFDKLGCNLWAIGKTIEAMRGIDRWGCSTILQKAFTGFTALPAASHEFLHTWYDILGVSEDSEPDYVRKQYKELAKKYHPDMITGDERMFQKITNAYEEYVKYRNNL